MIVGRDRSFMLVLFVVATMIAGPGLLRGANAEVPPVRSIAHSSEETKPLECELIRLLSEATGAHKTPTLECFFKKSRCDSLCDERCGGLFYEVPQGDSPRIHTLVAMVADPRQSQMALYFDQSLEALVSAAAKSGFLKDRFFLPWKSAATQGATGADYDGPGLMLFRSDREGRLEELLIVFLVGESPVLGAQRDDLNQAFRLADAVMTDQTAPLRVLGPFFSGSASSLARELAQLPDQNIERSAYVITGTATASTIDSAFKQVKNIEFYRTVAQDDELMAFLQDEICRQQPDARFALLSEIGTVYGNAFEKKEDEKTEYNSATAPHDEDSPEEYRECKRRPLTVFGFPLHISSLRAVRERTQDSAQAQVPTLRNTLELHLAPEEEGTRDMPPLFSTLAPYDVELALRQLLQRIGSEDDLTHVAIVATDPADVLFLGNEIRKYCPNVTLITLGGDLLYSHPDEDATMSGTVVASSYPLLFGSRALTKRRSQSHAFPSHTAQGFYNAAVAQLGEMRFSDDPRHRPALYGYQPLKYQDYHATEPQLWLTMIADSGFWPIATRPAEKGSLYRPDKPDKPGDDKSPFRPPLRNRVRSTDMAGTLAIVFLLAGILQLMRSVFFVRNGLWHWVPKVELLGGSVNMWRSERGCYLIATHLAFAGMTALALPAAYYGITSRDDRWFMTWSSLACVIGTLLIASTLGTAWKTIVAAWDLRPASGRAGYGRLGPLPHGWYPVAAPIFRLVVMGGLAVICAGASWHWYQVLHGSQSATSQALLLAARSLDPLGMSPLGPLFYLAVGFYLWGVCGLRRVTAFERFPLCSPLHGTTSCHALHRAIQALRGIYSGNMVVIELIILTVMVPCCLVFIHRVRNTFEGSPYDLLLQFGLLVLYAAVVTGFVRFVVGLFRLIRFLRQMVSLPMLDACDRVAMKVSSSFGLRLGARVPEADELELSKHNLRMLIGLANKLGDASEPDASPSSHDVSRVLKSCAATLKVIIPESRFPASGTALTPDAIGHRHADAQRQAHDMFFKASGILFRALNTLWKLRARVPQVDKIVKSFNLDSLLPKGDRADIPTAALFMRAVPPEIYLWTRMAEDFVMMRLVTFLTHQIFQLRNLLVFTWLGALMLVLAVGAYPLQPARLITVLTMILVLAVILGSFIAVIVMERNDVLHRLSGAGSGYFALKPAFMGRLLIYVLLPATALLSSIHPELSGFLFSWLEPLGRLMP